jgi:nucleoid DNA-binding protein
MNKHELIVRASAISGITQTEIRQCVTPFLEAMSDALLNGEPVSIREFGAFHIKEYPARNGRNPSTGETIIIPPRKAVRFKIKPGHKAFIGKGNKNSKDL